MKILKDEIKTNASSIYSDLGGGAHGHLGLVLTPQEYAHVSAIPYIQLVHPGPLVIPPGTAVGRQKLLCDAHKDACQQFKEMVDLEKVLVKQIVQAVPPAYMM